MLALKNFLNVILRTCFLLLKTNVHWWCLNIFISKTYLLLFPPLSKKEERWNSNFRASDRLESSCSEYLFKTMRNFCRTWWETSTLIGNAHVINPYWFDYFPGSYDHLRILLQINNTCCLWILFYIILKIVSLYFADTTSKTSDVCSCDLFHGYFPWPWPSLGKIPNYFMSFTILSYYIHNLRKTETLIDVP